MEYGERYQRGLAMRARVIGASKKEKAKHDDDFLAPLEQLGIEYAWGDIWTREDLDLKTRSLCTVAMLATLGCEAELRTHTKGALNNGATVEEIREVLVQVATYAGFPAALEAVPVVSDVIAEFESSRS